MKKGFLVLPSVMLFAVAPLFSTTAQEDLRRELELLKERVQQLEEKLKEQESKAEEAQEEHRKPLSAIVEVLKEIAIGFSALGVAQGSAGNHKNEGIPSDWDREDRVDGSVSADLEISKTIGDHGLATIILTGAYGGGLDERIPSWWGINGDAKEDNDHYILEVWYEHEFFDEKLVFTMGHVDLSNYFDSNEVANDEAAQFLAPGFVNSSAIKFPDDNGPGVRITVAPKSL